MEFSRFDQESRVVSYVRIGIPRAVSVEHLTYSACHRLSSQSGKVSRALSNLFLSLLETGKPTLREGGNPGHTQGTTNTIIVSKGESGD